MISGYKVKFFKLKNSEEIVSFVVTQRPEDIVMMYPLKCIQYMTKEDLAGLGMALLPIIPLDQGDSIDMPKTEIMFSCDVDEAMKDIYYARVKEVMVNSIAVRNEFYNHEKELLERKKSLH
jgi:hypothetical protein